jgi:phosphatidylethanolamine/phosphatidyl-N-methylethanolamine N-methyltransferase
MADKDKTWKKHRDNFSLIYESANYASFLQKTVMFSSHKLLEQPYSKNEFFSKILEVGAGSGEHLDFVNCQFNSYTITDLDPKMIGLAKIKRKSNENFKKLNFDTQSANKLSYRSSSFDRLIASHVLEHIYEPHKALEEWTRVIKNDGVLSILIPTDPGIAWRLGRHIGPRRHALSLGMPYDYLMAREHVNSCNNLIAILRYYFEDHIESWWPTKIPSIDLNLFFSFHAKIKK